MSAASKERDRAMASYMKAHPGQYPDSVMRPWNGEGASTRAMTKTMGSVSNESSKWEAGMLGGVLAARLGLGDFGIPDELIRPSHRNAA